MAPTCSMLRAFALAAVALRAASQQECGAGNECDEGAALLQKVTKPSGVDSGCSGRAPAKSALIVIDMQNDFINGTLPVAGGASIIPTINKLVALEGWAFVGYTMDYHPQNHASFAANSPTNSGVFSSVTMKYTYDAKLCGAEYAEIYGGSSKDTCSESEVAYVLEQTLWPVHCVQDTVGQQLHDDLVVPDSAVRVRKGYTSVVESYGAFENNLGTVESNLQPLLNFAGVKHVYMVGLALDYCVKNTALQSSKYFKTTVITDATKAVTPATGAAAVEQLGENGIDFKDAADISACR